MRKTKTVIFAVLLMISAFALCGCVRMDETLVMGEDAIIENLKVFYDKQKMDELYEDNQAELASMTIEVIDGKEYYTEVQSEVITYKELMQSNPSFIVSKEQYFYKSDKLDSSIDASKDPSIDGEVVFENISITVTFTSPIQVTNGVLSADGYSATWFYDSQAIASMSSVLRYAYTGAEHIAVDTATVDRKQKIANDKKKPVIKGVKNNKSYKGKSRTFYVKDNVGIKNIKLNGKKVKLKLIKKGKYKNYYKVTTKKQGKNKVTATDLNGNKKTLTFTLKK